MNKLESLQYQAGLAVTGMWQGTSRDRVYEELGWESLHLRRWFRRLTVFYKIINNSTPQYLREPVPSPRNHLYGTSNTNDLYPIRCRTQRFQNSFFLMQSNPGTTLDLTSGNLIHLVVLNPPLLKL